MAARAEGWREVMWYCVVSNQSDQQGGSFVIYPTRSPFVISNYSAGIITVQISFFIRRS
jgi:hypothetical protein